MSEETSKITRHIQVSNDIKFKPPYVLEDSLVYAYLKSYMNKDTKSCYPSLATLKKDTLLKNPMPNKKDIWDNVQRDNDIISISNAEAKANDKSLSLEEMINDAFKDAGREKGSSKSLNNGHFKNTELQKDN